MATPLVFEVRGVAKRFGTTQALRDVSVQFWGGEVHCLLGENGAGKSTLGKVVGGLVSPDCGELWFDGHPVRFRSVTEARRQGIAMVFQELSLAPHLTVAENICLGTELGRNPWRRIRWRQEEATCRILLAELDLDVDPGQPVAQLPVATQQLVEVVKAVAQRPRLLILDEPTAMLGLVEKRTLLALIHRLRSTGIVIILVTHHVRDVLDVADRVSLMREGAIVQTFAMTADVDARELVLRLTGGRLLQETCNGAILPQTDREALLSLHGLSVMTGLEDVRIGRGQVVGLYGVAGCGREEICEALVGLRRHGRMSMTLAGRAYRPGSPSAAARLGVTYLPSGRAANGILPSRSIRENLTLGSRLGRTRYGLIAPAAERNAVRTQLARLQVQLGAFDDLITSLSGGNQQKIVLGRCLGRTAQLMVLEDPTAGIDVAARHDIHALIREQASQGMAILLLSNDLLETIALCDVTYTLSKGRVVARYDNPTLADEAQLVADVLEGSAPGGGAGIVKQEMRHAAG